MAAPSNASGLVSPRFEIVKADASEALRVWKDLASAGRGYPLLLGPKDGAQRVLEDAESPWVPDMPTTEQILETAKHLTYPASLMDERRGAIDEEVFSEAPLPDGSWPTEPYIMRTWAYGYSWAQEEPEVFIAILPLKDGAEAPALLRWGGWNDCPVPAQHVAALRSWFDRFGAILLSLGSDTLDVFVSRPPTDRVAALALARELYIYCPDLVDQGFQSLGELAASLMESQFWNFWWD
ncbi:DUF4253 domain-containing protein [Zavarzinia compransoris]|uniref:DUF4253 domain-containing protein n=1 Tax=Zavarzinia marina TaxID=2911065 RepID=UPI001F2BA4BB|nr:DUF4253 domain-containing protein [Zavarzinia marina]MCF4167286.1 DUF4253 domain-containing protein [Zavarzinia marina]